MLTMVKVVVMGYYFRSGRNEYKDMACIYCGIFEMKIVKIRFHTWPRFTAYVIKRNKARAMVHTYS